MGADRDRAPTDRAGETFRRQTFYCSLAPSDQQRGRPAPPLVLPLQEACDRTPLPSPEALGAVAVDFRELVTERTSVRDYAPGPVYLAELSLLLWCTQGVKEVWEEAATLRTVPSAGARHALETFLICNRVEGLDEGLYRYLPLTHELTPVRLGPAPQEECLEACLGQSMVHLAALTVIWAAVPYRMTWRYGERGYRYLYLDAGHACQNLYLAAEAVECGACAIAAFDDEKLDQCLGIDGAEAFSIYVATIGRKLVV